ncbi:MAG TPA: type II toxin-antitoxin system PemK/MazF family toxin [Candidatus Absconditabacterales bacterium]|nr:type II toxin-antitoxin system PemK/MazF family toxin [Candidatus Absconditabacterales bacterium]
MDVFDKRNEQKRETDKSETKVYFKERDIFFIKMGKNIGREQNGKGAEFARPVIIIKKFTNHLFRGIAITTKEKEGIYYYNFELQKDRGNRIAILSQIKLYDSKRLLSKIGFINKKDFLNIRKKLTELLQ